MAPAGAEASERRYASFWSRLGAGSVDWTLCFAPLFLLPAAWLVAVPAAIIVYFTAGLALGGTLGMRIFRLRPVHEDGASPGPARAFLRSLLALATAAGVVVLVVAGFSDPPASGYAAGERALFYAAVALVSASLGGHLWHLVDPRGQSWHDRLFRLTVVRVPADPPPRQG